MSFSKAGAKVRSLFQTAKRFAKFFRSFFRRLPGEGPSAWASLAKGGTVAAYRPERTAPNVSATSCQASPLPFRKRVQKYGLFPFTQNTSKVFSELFRRITRKMLDYRYVGKHVFTRLMEGEKRRHTLYYYTRAQYARVTITVTERKTATYNQESNALERGKQRARTTERMYTRKKEDVQELQGGCAQTESRIRTRPKENVHKPPSKTRKVENDIKTPPEEKKCSFYKAKANRIFSRRFWISYLCPPNFYFLSFKHHEKAIRTIRGMRSCRM